MDIEKVKEYLSYLEEKYTEWYANPKQRSRIASEIYTTAMNWDDEIYLHLMGSDNATSLFEHGFFESDVQRALRLLKDIVNEAPQPANKLHNLYTKLQNYKASQSEVVKKELKDYLLEKIHNGELKGGEIIFKNDEDLEYFKQLANNLGFDVDAILEDIIMQSFNN